MLSKDYLLSTFHKLNTREFILKSIWGKLNTMSATFFKDNI